MKYKETWHKKILHSFQLVAQQNSADGCVCLEDEVSILDHVLVFSLSALFKIRKGGRRKACISTGTDAEGSLFLWI